MNKAINLAGLPNTFTQLLLNLLNSAVIHVPGRAPERRFLEKGGEGGFISVHGSGPSKSNSLSAAILLSLSCN